MLPRSGNKMLQSTKAESSPEASAAGPRGPGRKRGIRSGTEQDRAGRSGRRPLRREKLHLHSRRSRAGNVVRPRVACRGPAGRVPTWLTAAALRPSCAPSSSVPGRPGAASPPPMGACSGRLGGGAAGGSLGPSQYDPEDGTAAQGGLPGPLHRLSRGSRPCSCRRASPIASARTTCPTSCGIPCRSAWPTGVGGSREPRVRETMRATRLRVEVGD